MGKGSSKSIPVDEHFGSFAKVLEDELARMGAPGGAKACPKSVQQGMIEQLVVLESEFRDALLACQQGRDFYRDFCAKVGGQGGNLPSVRPCFRERQQRFVDVVAGAIRSVDLVVLSTCGVNHQFIRRALAWGYWEDDHPVRVLAAKHAELRDAVIVRNLPLAISRARIFWRSTPRSHLSHMDLVQIATEGLIAAVDKYCLPWTGVFPAVVIGRCLGGLIESYSETTLHFYPKDKKKLYRARKLSVRGKVPLTELVDGVNEVADSKGKTTEEELGGLLAASSVLSADTERAQVGDLGRESIPLLSKMAAPDRTRPDVAMEAASAAQALVLAVKTLPHRDRKLLALRGCHSAVLY